MQKKLLVGFWRFILKVPPALLEKQLQAARRKFEKELAFMSPEHRRIHHWIVRELPGYGRPMAAEVIAAQVDLPLDRVRPILEDLDAHMTFICRNQKEEVVWAYPVTLEKTPHHVTFGTGEQVYAA